MTDYLPCVAFRNAYKPDPFNQPAMLYFARYDAPSWDICTIDTYPVVGPFPPQVSPPSICIDAYDMCYKVHSGIISDGPDKAYIILKTFPCLYPQTETMILDSAIVPEAWKLCSPSIDLDNNGYPHIVYDFPPEAGEPYGEIYYRCRSATGWSPKVNISESFNLPSEHPFIEVTGEKVIVVWTEEEELGNEESREIWKGERLLTHPPDDWVIWREVETPNQTSDWPMITANDGFLIWCEHIFIDTEQNWEVLYKSPIYGSGNLSNSSYTQSLYPSCDWRQTTTSLYLYTAFSEFYETEPTLFGIEVKKDRFIPGIPMYTVYGGDEIPSPYCIERDGFIAYDEYPVDYDTTELIYKFTGLKPDLKYRLDATAYHESSGEWREWVKIDNTAQHLIKYQAGVPQTVELPVPPASYMDDGEIVVRIPKIQGDFAMLCLSNLYESEKESTGGGPQDASSSPSNDGKPMLSIFPNPAQKEINIQYTLPKRTDVKISIYDVTGRLVKNIVNENQKHGTYSKSFDITNLSQGIYFIKLNTSDKSIVEKAIFLK